ncbi:MAG: cbb3-type cytochrome oxidase assembly protein CcoS [Alcaligenaceae bacterium]|nr:cbb3-type cytochrome oxidase assembly protein CcoS [Alcaligenaceae bacterium]
MKIYMILGAITIVIIAFISFFLYWAVFKGQYDDIDEKGDSILFDDDSTSQLVTNDRKEVKSSPDTDK